MEIINIEIPDNLKSKEEFALIVKYLSKKMLPQKNKAIGSGYVIKELNTTINIKRIVTEKITITYTCPICNTIFDKLSSNYGGTIKQNRTCSIECSEKYISLLNPDRCNFSKKKLIKRHVRAMFN